MAMWYYADGADRQGPVEATDIERLIASGSITADTLVWREGMEGWEPASQHFSTGAGAPPPLSSAPPPMSGTPPPVAGASGAGQIGSDGLYVGAPSRSFGEAISTCFSKYVTFSGRASRSEYWFYMLFLFVAGIVVSILDAIIFPGSLETGGPFNAILTLGTFLPSLAVSWRRLHDTDRSGWWIGGFYLGLVAVFAIVFAAISGSGNEDLAIGLMPLLGLGVLAYMITLLVFLCQKGTLGPNRFG